MAAEAHRLDARTVFRPLDAGTDAIFCTLDPVQDPLQFQEGTKAALRGAAQQWGVPAEALVETTCERLREHLQEDAAGEPWAGRPTERAVFLALAHARLVATVRQRAMRQRAKDAKRKAAMEQPQQQQQQQQARRSTPGGSRTSPAPTPTPTPPPDRERFRAFTPLDLGVQASMAVYAADGLLRGGRLALLLAQVPVCASLARELQRAASGSCGAAVTTTTTIISGGRQRSSPVLPSLWPWARWLAAQPHMLDMAVFGLGVALAEGAGVQLQRGLCEGHGDAWMEQLPGAARQWLGGWRGALQELAAHLLQPAPALEPARALAPASPAPPLPPPPAASLGGTVESPAPCAAGAEGAAGAAAVSTASGAGGDGAGADGAGAAGLGAQPEAAVHRAAEAAMHRLLDHLELPLGVGGRAGAVGGGCPSARAWLVGELVRQCGAEDGIGAAVHELRRVHWGRAGAGEPQHLGGAWDLLRSVGRLGAEAAVELCAAACSCLAQQQGGPPCQGDTGSEAAGAAAEVSPCTSSWLARSRLRAVVDACEQLLGAVGPVLQQVDPRRLPDEQGGTSDVMPRLQAARRAFVEAAGRSGMGSVEAGLKHLLDQARAEAAGDGDGNAGWGGAEARSTLLLAEALQRLAREVDTERRGTAECLDHMQRAEQQQGEQIQRLAREV